MAQRRKSPPAETCREPQQAASLDLTAAMRRLCEHLVVFLPELQHVDMPRVALRICQTRRRGPYGVQATMTPLRFRDGSTTTIRRGRRWVIHPLPRDEAGRDYLYLFSLYVPRFLDLPHAEKLAVTIHELWHISPAFDGDLRRFPGRYHAHGASCDKYHRDMRHLARQWLAAQTEAGLHDFLAGDFDTMRRRYGRVYGARYPTPRLWQAEHLRKRGLSDAAHQTFDDG